MPPYWWYYVIASVTIADCNESGDPNCITFEHVAVWAESEEQALLEGQRVLGFHQAPGVIKNDYAFRARL